MIYLNAEFLPVGSPPSSGNLATLSCQPITAVPRSRDMTSPIDNIIYLNFIAKCSHQNNTYRMLQLLLILLKFL